MTPSSDTNSVTTILPMWILLLVFVRFPDTIFNSMVAQPMR